MAKRESSIKSVFVQMNFLYFVKACKQISGDCFESEATDKANKK
jgi:hypothetical protein